MAKKIIQIKNAKKIFKRRIFKIRGHDFPKLLDKISKKISTNEGVRLLKVDNYFRKKWGDYEVYIKVHKNKIEFIDFLEK